ncbi:MAG: hypothetical protein QOC94_2599 [Actinoplanes sp.]|nr:hypothetical protein [Actinoplanes sp.]
MRGRSSRNDCRRTAAAPSQVTPTAACAAGRRLASAHAPSAADPVRGTIDVTRLRPVVADNVGARVGRLSRTTLSRVDDALRNYLRL